jgi:type I restriction enzyme M protein
MAIGTSQGQNENPPWQVIDITQLNTELKTTVAKIDQLRSDIDAIVAEIEGNAA